MREIALVLGILALFVGGIAALFLLREIVHTAHAELPTQHLAVAFVVTFLGAVGGAGAVVVVSRGAS